IEEATGRNVDRFFDQGLYQAGHPEFELSWSWDESAKQVELRTKQTQEVKDPVPLFKVSASVELAWPDRTQNESIRIEQADQVFRFDAPRRPRAVLFDPEATLLGGAKDKDSRVRRGVYRALGNFRKDEVAFKALAKAYREDGWYYPMNAAALALAETRHEQAFETIVEGMDRRSQAEILARG